MQSNAIMIRNQIPEYIIEAYPAFVAFIETYYQYAMDRNSGVGAIHFHSQNTDIDTTLDEYIDKFYDTYGEYLPKTLSADRRNFIKLLNDIYAAKGTEKALKLLFQGLYGEEISVSYPGDSILRASDGKWYQERFLTVRTLYGQIPNSLPYNLVFGPDSSGFTVQITGVDVSEPARIRFFFDARVPVSVSDSQEFSIFDENDSLIWAGQLVQTPGVLKIVSPGLKWKIGQVITIPGAIKDTIARVTKISSTGEVTGVEILEHGIGHANNQLTTISPYPNKPAPTDVSVESTMVSFSPLVYNHVIGINDYTSGFTEVLSGVSDSLSNPNQYFLESYTQPGYTGYQVIDSAFVSTASEMIEYNTSITYADWLASRATFEYIPQNMVKTKGYYTEYDGHISNQEVRLQDNFFYQVFAYVISTTKDISEYKSALRTVHPAGTKMFSLLTKEVAYSIGINSSRTLSLDTFYLSDIAQIEDLKAVMNVGKAIADILELTDVVQLNIGKLFNDGIVFTDDGISQASETYADTSYAETSFSTFETTIQVG